MPVTFTTDFFAAQDAARSNPGVLPDANIGSGDIEFAVIPYTLTSGTDEAAADIIELMILPAGSIPIPQLSSITASADPGTAFTVDVGNASNPDGWGDAVALTVAGKVEFCTPSGTMPAWLAETRLSADATEAGAGQGNTRIYATVDTSTAPTAGVILYFTLAFKRGRG